MPLKYFTEEERRKARYRIRIASYARNAAKREMKWNTEFLSCIKHPNVRCQRVQYIRRCHRTCNQCRNNLALKIARQSRWEAQFISCRRHSTKRCNRSLFVSSGARRCGMCKHSPSHARYANSQRNSNVRSYRVNVRLWLRKEGIC